MKITFTIVVDMDYYPTDFQVEGVRDSVNYECDSECPEETTVEWEECDDD